MYFNNFKQKDSAFLTKVSSKENTVQGVLYFSRAYFG
jgi:hypothetical protein